MKVSVKRANGDAWDLEGTAEELAAFVQKNPGLLPWTFAAPPPSPIVPVAPGPFDQPWIAPTVNPPIFNPPFWVGGDYTTVKPLVFGPCGCGELHATNPTLSASAPVAASA